MHAHFWQLPIGFCYSWARLPHASCPNTCGCGLYANAGLGGANLLHLGFNKLACLVGPVSQDHSLCSSRRVHAFCFGSYFNGVACWSNFDPTLIKRIPERTLSWNNWPNCAMHPFPDLWAHAEQVQVERRWWLAVLPLGIPIGCTDRRAKCSPLRVLFISYRGRNSFFCLMVSGLRYFGLSHAGLDKCPLMNQCFGVAKLTSDCMFSARTFGGLMIHPVFVFTFCYPWFMSCSLCYSLVNRVWVWNGTIFACVDIWWSGELASKSFQIVHSKIECFAK